MVTQDRSRATSRHGMLDRTPCEARELIAGFTLVSPVWLSGWTAAPTREFPRRNHGAVRGHQAKWRPWPHGGIAQRVFELGGQICDRGRWPPSHLPIGCAPRGGSNLRSDDLALAARLGLLAPSLGSLRDTTRSSAALDPRSLAVTPRQEGVRWPRIPRGSHGRPDIAPAPLNWAYQQACAPVLDVST